MPEPNDKGTPPDDKGGDKNTPKTYTQEEYDALVAERDSFKETAGQLDELYKNPRFTTFVEDENRRMVLGDEEYEKIYGGKEPDISGGHEPNLENMSDEERTAYEHDKELRDEINSLREQIATLQSGKEADEVEAEYKALTTDKEKYPLFDSTIEINGQQRPVRELMSEELEKAMAKNQHMTMETAYKIVTYGQQKALGRKEYEDILAKKREAASIGIPVSSPGKPTESKKEFKDARAAVEATLSDMGL